MKHFALIGAILIGYIALDRVTKLAFMEQSADRGLSLIPGVLETTHHQNFGVIANLPIPLILIIGLTFFALAVLIVLLKRSIETGTPIETMALSGIMAGALGNLWDRLQWGYVFDWILLFNRSVINLADIFIAEGLLLYILTRHLKHRSGR